MNASLKLFYNNGRLPLKLEYGTSRVMWVQTACNMDWLKTEQGYHCIVCGNHLTYRGKYCGYECERYFERNIRHLDFWTRFRERVYKRDNEHCTMCGNYTSDYVCDHIVPLFKGGIDWWQDPDMTNFQTLCEDCNKIKTRHDVAKPKVIKQRLGLKTMQYAGFVFEQTIPENNTLMQFISEKK